MRTPAAVADYQSEPPLGLFGREQEGLHSTILQSQQTSNASSSFADAQGRDNDEAAAIIREKAGFEYFPHPIIRRKAFRNAAAAGLSVAEFRPGDEKAIRELRLFANHIFGYTGDIVSISYGNRKASCPKDKDQRQAG